MAEVLVVGGGAAGMMAAIFAARAGAEVTLLEHNEKLGKKIREANLQKVIYTAVIGDQEVADKTCAVSSRFDGKLGSMSVDGLAEVMLKEINDKVRHEV